MKNNKHKILVLSDLNKSVTNTIKSSITLAKIVSAEINFLCVKGPTEVVGKESQLSAMRTINQEYITTDKKIKNLINPISKNYDININHTFTIGNIKSEISNYIDENKPDIIVLGKRKSKMFGFMGDNITKFVLDKYKGTIVIANDDDSLEPNKELYLSLFSNTNANNIFTENILRATQKPLKFFNFQKNSTLLKEEPILKDKKIVEYVFNEGDNSIKNISNYLLKSNINLLLINRKNENKNLKEPNIKEVINNLNCSLILTT